ncbi:hypothetical protein C1H76_9278 [Elsinoe australis]|uniref:Ima1 N-terminal domain-containing protein n=1 Tax=Elsinoe australis TaxID=40998 RepID=A0A4U7AL96_9PEZI|nr:hypothetical protein C1H76_9278 [Elsinoe australis]
MPSLLRQRIYCFYCGSKSPHRKGDKIARFQCAQCEGTNFLDEHGEITDVPAEAIGTPTQTEKRYATVRQPSVSPQGAAASSGDGLFCNQCLKNQRFLADCLANYLPSENDPRYAEFEAGYPEYKKELEKRYPPVCSKCEPRVRDRLKKSSYAAKSVILAKSLLRKATFDPAYTSGLSWRTSWNALLILVECMWWTSSLIQAAWHLLGARQTIEYPWVDVPHGRAPHAVCNAEFWIAVKYSLWCTAAISWWNPSLLRLHNVRTVHKVPFYGLQAAVLAIRYSAWYVLGRTGNGWDDQTTKAAHAFTLAVIAMSLLISYRVIVPAPRQKFEFRSLDEPLIDEDSVQYPQTDFTSNTMPGRRQNGSFKIRNFAPRSEFSPTSTASSHSTQLAGADFRPPQPRPTRQPEDDRMDWEPSHSHYSLRPRAREPVPDPPITQQVEASVPSPSFSSGPSPFYGSLPPAPRSLEARLRTAAQKQPPQFKPVRDSKQADWFKRMGLAQSKTSWANKEYTRTVEEPDKRNMELAEGKLKLNSFGIASNDGTGLEDIFGKSFKLDDNSPTKEEHERVDHVAKQWGLAEKSAIILPVVIAFWMAFTYLAPDQAWSIGSWTQSLVERARSKAYGR